MRLRRELIPLLAASAWFLGHTASHAQTGPGNPVSVGPYTYSYIQGAATTVIKARVGILHYVCVNTPIAGDTVTLYDNTAASGQLVGIIKVPATAPNPFCQRYDVLFTTGITVVTSGADDVTVAYR